MTRKMVGACYSLLLSCHPGLAPILAMLYIPLDQMHFERKNTDDQKL